MIRAVFHRLAGVVLLALLGCAEHPATQVVVVLHAEPALRAEAVRLAVVVEGPQGEVAVDRTDDVPASTVGPLARIPIVPAGGDVTRTFRITATLLGADDTPLARVEASAGYAKDTLAEVHVWFEDACAGVLDCGVGRTCVGGTCVGACYRAVDDTVERSEPICGACERCADDTCVAIADGDPCGCPQTDRCEAGACVTSKAVNSVYSGDQHTCADVSPGGLYCWGSNRVGQLGTSGSSTTSPVRVDLAGTADVTAATDHTCAATHGGNRHCWGWNGSGQIGLGAAESKAYRVPTEAPADDPLFAELTSGWFHTCGLERGGGLSCWGNNRDGASAAPEVDPTVDAPRRVNEDTDWTAVEAGGFHTCGLKGDGTIWCWGLNGSGELGIGDNASRDAPIQTGCVGGTCFTDWVAIGTGSFHTCAIRASEEMWCWGGGLNGQLGVGPLNEDNSLRPLALQNTGWRAVSGGQSHTCALQADKSLYCFGRNDNGQLGLGDVLRRDVPERVGDAPYIRVRLGRNHTCAIREDRTLWCWGRNEQGQLGLGFKTPIEDPPISAPRRVCFPPG